MAASSQLAVALDSPVARDGPRCLHYPLAAHRTHTMRSQAVIVACLLLATVPACLGAPKASTPAPEEAVLDRRV